MNRTSILGLLFLMSFSLLAQVNYTANDIVSPYEGYYRPGCNMGYYPSWDDEELADIAAGNEALGIDGAGVRAIRPLLPEEFLEQYGYDYRLPTFEHYESINLRENTCIVGFPRWSHRDQQKYCYDWYSEMFDNMYTPIFDNGENGTPVNDDNYLALYLWKVATTYGDHIRFWEIWNEPGFDYTGAKGWLPPGAEGNWWDNNPDPCDYKLRAPIFHYVRTLRISYEVLKYVNPDAYVTVAGTGYPSFLDAILRNTDNPEDGTVTAEYPLGGGAYFDVMGFHSYPAIDGSLREWNNDIFDFIYYRHSDAAAEGILKRQNRFQTVLSNYGYDGETYPRKEWIITEINLPRQSFGGNIGSLEAQQNFMIKALVTCSKAKIHQTHVFNLGDKETDAEAFDAFDIFGFYKKLNATTPYNQVKNTSATAHKTASDFLFEKRHDPVRTTAMQLPDGVRGEAFKDSSGNYVYVLWAKTQTDLSEAASATYSFPNGFEIVSLNKMNWDFSATNNIEQISPTDIQLTSSPIFVTTNYTGNPTAGVDLELSVSADHSVYEAYEHITYTLTLSNTGSDPASQVKVRIDYPEDAFAYTGSSTAVGTYSSWHKEWTVGAMPAGANVVLEISLFTVLEEEPLGFFAQVSSGNGTDIDSSPGNNFSNMPSEDDEALVVIPVAGGDTGGGGVDPPPPGTETYCETEGEQPWNQHISRVIFGSINNSSGKDGYGDYTDLSTMVIPNTEYAISVQPKFSWNQYDEYIKVWIDYNGDGDFEDDNENVFTGIGPAGVSGTTPPAVQGIVVIPNDALIGTTRMRVSMQRDAYADPCEVFKYGEVEDYTVQVIPPPMGFSGGNYNFENKLHIFPNPTQERLMISLSDYQGLPATVQVYNILGEQIYQEEIHFVSGNPMQLNTSKWMNGIYTLHIKVKDKKRMTRSFVVDRPY